jgi:hypothetical protein
LNFLSKLFFFSDHSSGVVSSALEKILSDSRWASELFRAFCADTVVSMSEPPQSRDTAGYYDAWPQDDGYDKESASSVHFKGVNWDRCDVEAMLCMPR